MAVEALLSILLPIFWLCCSIVLVQAARSPRNVALWYFSIAVLLLVVLSSLASIDSDLTAVERLLYNLLSVAAVYFQVCFLRTALRQHGGRLVFLGETAVAVVVMLIATGSWLLAPAALRPDLAQPKNSTNLSAFIFQISLLGYGFVTSSRMVVWCFRLFRKLREQRLPGRRLAEIGFEAGLIVIIAAKAALFAAVAGKIVSVIAVFTDPSGIPTVQPFFTPLALITGLGNFLFVVGIIIPIVCGAVATVLVGLRHRRDHRTLEPLWSHARAAFPQLPLRTRGGVNGQFYRRGLEVKDSLLLLAPFYDVTVADAAEARCLAVGSSPQETSARVAAALVADALDNQQTGRLIADPHPVPISGADDWSSDMAWLLRVATAFTTTSPTTASGQYS